MPRTMVTRATMLILLLCASCTRRVDSPVTAELDEAVAIGVAAMARQSKSPDTHTLIGAERFYSKGKYVWRITFKPRALLPDDPSAQPIGAGGETFITVDLETGASVVTRGE